MRHKFSQFNYMCFSYSLKLESYYLFFFCNTLASSLICLVQSTRPTAADLVAYPDRLCLKHLYTSHRNAYHSDVYDCRVIRPLVEYEDWILDLLWFTDGKRFALITAHNKLLLTDAESGQIISAHQSTLNCILYPLPVYVLSKLISMLIPIHYFLHWFMYVCAFLVVILGIAFWSGQAIGVNKLSSF